MAGILGGNGQKTPRYTDINLQTSAQGLPIPVLWGTNRVGTNIIWYGDFKSRTTSVAGKGGLLGGGSEYYYSCAVILALCEGPIQGINQVWANGTLTNLGALDLSLVNGTATQPPWSYLESAYPSQALSYARTAYVCSGAYQLGTSPDLPSHNFEVIGNLAGTIPGWQWDANPADIILDYLTNPQYSIGFTPSKLAANLSNYRTYCMAQGIFLSPAMNQQEQYTQTLQRWAQLTNSFIFWSGNQMQFVPLGDSEVTGWGSTYTPQLTPIYNLTYDDFLCGTGEDPVTVNFVDPADGYNQVQLDISDRNNSYNSTPILWQDQTSVDQYGALMANVISAPEICEITIANIIAPLIGQRSVYITKSYTFKLSRRFIFLEPGDIVTLTDPNIGLNQFPVRILSVKSGTDRNLTVTAEECPYGIGTVATYAGQTSGSNATFNTLAEPGNVNPPAIFEPNAALTGGAAQVWVAASGGANWGGCQVQLSFDGETYSNIGTITAGALQGALITALPATADPDMTDTLEVDLSESLGVLPSTATEADANALRTLILVDNELMAYGSVTPGTLNSYSFDLTYLRRAQYGTALAAHAAGDDFTRVDQSSIFTYDLPSGYVDTPLYFKFVSFNTFGNALQDVSAVAEYTYTPVGTAFTIGAPGVPAITPSSTTQSDGTTILSLTAAWTPSAGPNLGRYEVQWSANAGATWTNDGTVGSASLSTGLSPALASTAYLVRVRAISQNGQAISAWSTSASTNSGALVSGPPAAPAGIAASAVAGGAMVSWTPSASASAKGYQISYGTTNVFSAATLYGVTTSGTGQLITGLTAGTPYYFWVQAYNGAGASAPDGPATATPTGISAGVTVQAAGAAVVTNANTINIIGAGATVTNVGNVATINIPGGGGGGSAPIQFDWIGSPAASQELAYMVFGTATTLPAGLTGAVAVCAVAPTSAVALTIMHNGTAVGTINFATGAKVGTFTFASAVAFAVGDTLSVIAPSAVDATFATVAATLGQVGNSLISCFSAYLSASQSGTAGAFVTVVFKAKSFDLLSEYNTSTGTFTPTQSGYYQFSAGIGTTNATAGQEVALSIFVNGTEYRRIYDIASNSAVYTTALGGTTGPIYLTAGQAVTCRFYVSGTSVTMGATSIESYFSGFRVA